MELLRGMQHLGDNRLPLWASEATGLTHAAKLSEGAQKLDPERLVSGRAMAMPSYLALSSLLTATATITATDTRYDRARGSSHRSHPTKPAGSRLPMPNCGRPRSCRRS
jgi:hypothetical protein